jgi:quercetin dioxygenase-like cupin family protein
MKRILACIAFATLAFTTTAGAQQLPSMTNQTANIKRTPLQKFDVPGANYETVIGLAEIAPNANVGRHTHPGVEGGYLIEGGMTLLVEGQPPKEIKPGDSWQIPPGTIHDAKAGSGGAKVIASYVVEKGKPLASPAP